MNQTEMKKIAAEVRKNIIRMTCAAPVSYTHLVDADWFWIMDDDTIPNYDCLEKLLEANDSLNKNEDYNTGKRKISFFASSIFCLLYTSRCV